MCNCGKKRPAPTPAPKPSSAHTQEFALDLNGRTQRFGSRLEAFAANVRAGGAGVVKPVVR